MSCSCCKCHKDLLVWLQLFICMVKFDLNQARMTPTKKKPKGKGEHGAGWGVWVTLNRVPPWKFKGYLPPTNKPSTRRSLWRVSIELYITECMFLCALFFVLRRTTVNGSMLNYRCIVFVKFNKYLWSILLCGFICLFTLNLISAVFSRFRTLHET